MKDAALSPAVRIRVGRWPSTRDTRILVPAMASKRPSGPWSPPNILGDFGSRLLQALTNINTRTILTARVNPFYVARGKPLESLRIRGSSRLLGEAERGLWQASPDLQYKLLPLDARAYSRSRRARSV
jgi:hypothetical protein